jgi:hypothetical protein
MNEQLLRFIWQFRLFNTTNLHTVNGEPVELIHCGYNNTDAGPDFREAKIKIAGTLWAGNVELHVKSSDWFLHKHQTDTAYDNVILHVVYEHNGQSATRKNGEPIPAIELKKLINPHTLSRYEQLSKQPKGIACKSFYPQAAAHVSASFLSRLLTERLQSKVERINDMLREDTGDWEHVMFRLIARYLGSGINREPFELLAKSLPVKVWVKHSNDLLQLEALLFGQAGFLEGDFEDDYPKQLRKEYLYLKRLYQLEPLPKHLWKMLRLRPANFPTIRLAQLAAVLQYESGIFSTLTGDPRVKAVHRFFDVQVSPYWQTHYTFDKESKAVRSGVGAATKNLLLINAIAPLLFAYGKYKSDESYCDKALELLESVKPESNAILNNWEALGVKPANAFDTQALLQLKNEYCDKHRCLQCTVGLQILK